MTLILNLSFLQNVSLIMEKGCPILHTSHPARHYCDDRKLPKLDVLYYTPDFKFVVDKVSKGHNIPKNEKRIVIPFFNEKCELIALQGRSLDPKNSLRYITIKVKDVPKVYGLDRIESRKNSVYNRGPIRFSLFG